MRLSIIMPVLNEAADIGVALQALQGLRARGAEVIVADGGSTDETVRTAMPLCDLLVRSPRGRARQMNAGSDGATGDVLLFLHADTRLPENADLAISSALALTRRKWGRFDVAIEGAHPMLRIIAAMMNRRSRLTGIATGDQAIFIRRETFDAVNGFPDIALMEDVAISKKLRRLSLPACIRAKVRTSGRRWETRGVWRTIFLMWRLRLAYFFGADPKALAIAYGYRPPDE